MITERIRYHNHQNSARKIKNKGVEIQTSLQKLMKTYECFLIRNRSI